MRRVCVGVNVCVTAFHRGQRWRVSEREGPMWPSVMWAETFRLRAGELAQRWGNRWWRKGVRRRRDVCVCVCVSTACNWPTGPCQGQVERECVVVCGRDPPSCAPACPPSPHTSKLFILCCGKITVLAVSSALCMVSTLHACTLTTPPRFPAPSVTNKFRIK